METTTAAPSTTSASYAGFGARLVAYIIDAIVVGCVYWVLALILAAIGMGAAAAAGGPEGIAVGDEAAIGAIFAGMGLMILLITVAYWLYGAIMESSGSQGTLGKMAMGIKVTDLNGGRISFGRALLRQFGKYISGSIMMIGYLMVAFTEKKQGLHDMIASTFVVKK